MLAGFYKHNMKQTITNLIFSVVTSVCIATTYTAHAVEVSSQDYIINVEILVEGLNHPWSLAFLPDGNMLVTERVGTLRLIQNDKLVSEPVSGLPPIEQHGQGGLMDVVVHPDFKTNHLIYLAYAGEADEGLSTEVLRGKLVDDRLEDVEVIFAANGKTSGGRHFGGRLLFDNEGKLFITLGDRGQRNPSQDLASHTGSLIRINDDGSIPKDNPFLNDKNAQPEIYSYGHRNIQGIALKPETNIVWTHEHGPQGGDEINIIQAGNNYGWPVITYGKNYVIGTRIGEGTHKEGMEQPLYYWTPSIAPSGMMFYTGDEFPLWKGNLFVGSLKFGLLVRLVIEDDEVVHEERLLKNKFGRIRDVRQGPDGAIYLLTDDSRGSVLRLSNAGVTD